MAETLGFALGACSLGEVLTAVSAKGLCLVMMADDKATLVREQARFFPNAHFQPDTGRDSVAALARVIDLIEGRGDASNPGLTLDIRGTDFQKRVWHELQNLPAGQTLSYAQLAGRIGAPKAFRAVAGACGANRLAVIIPCHRVVAANGRISGYRWGVERKRSLLFRESRLVNPG